MWDLEVHIFNPYWGGSSRWVSELQVSQGYTVRPSPQQQGWGDGSAGKGANRARLNT